MLCLKKTFKNYCKNILFKLFLYFKTILFCIKNLKNSFDDDDETRSSRKLVMCFLSKGEKCRVNVHLVTET